MLFDPRITHRPDSLARALGVTRESLTSYVPRRMLSVAPSPIGPVVIDYPAIRAARDRYVSELSLFIDESGRVSRVRVDGQALPREFEEAARSAFLGVRFQPGQLEGRVVRSRIRVEVSFDTVGPGR